LATTNGAVVALQEFDDGGTPYLFAAGSFNGVGTLPANAIARWNGSTWSTLGLGMNGQVFALASFDDGSGPALYAGGAFTTANGVSTNHIARWRASAWSGVGGGMNNHVYSLAVFDDGTGPALYAGGGFTSAGGTPANRIARWNGSSWQALGAGLDGIPASLAVHDDGSGPALYAGGTFSAAGGVSANSIARWDGTNWSSLGQGFANGNSYELPYAGALVSFDFGTGGGPHLYVGGTFETADGIPSSNIAEWGVCPDSGISMCSGDGSIGPCPCSNFGLAGNGCENSASTGGAHLAAFGTTRPDDVLLSATGETPYAISVFLQGRTVIISGSPFGDGLLCAGPTLVRLYVKRSSGGCVSAPMEGEEPIDVRSAALGDPIVPGERRYYQVYYRDGAPAFCPPPTGGSFNATNAVKIVW
jgi:hypothetical protein